MAFVDRVSTETQSHKYLERGWKMRITIKLVLFAGAMIGSLYLVGSVQSNAQQRPNAGQGDKLDQILRRLHRIEEQLNAPSATATFCISQGRGMELAADWGGGVKVEGNLGVGWTSALYAKGAPKLELPILMPVPPFVLPSDAHIGFTGGLGRGTDICVDIPITLSPDDQTRLDQIALDINQPQSDLFDKSKFQRRASRAINYAAVRVPGNQRTFAQQREMQLTGRLTTAQSDEEAESEFDRADASADSLLDGGFEPMQEGLDVFRDGRITELLSAMEVPVGVRDFMIDPERMFDALPDLRGGDGPIFCNDIGLSGAMRQRNARLDGFCSRLEDLPTFDRVRNASDTIAELSDEVVDAIAQVMAPVLGNAGETADQTKSRFCASRVGQRPAFDRYCGR
jgi:hypothetical protein